MNLDHLFSVIEADALCQTDALRLVGNQVTSANSLSDEAANDYLVKPVIQEKVRPFLVAQIEPLNEVSINGENLKPTTDNLPSEISFIPMQSTDYRNSVVTPVISTADLTHPLHAEPITATELNALLVSIEKPLFYHLLDCSICHVAAGQYCADGVALGHIYDALLVDMADAQAIRQRFVLAVDGACISDHRRYTAFNRNVPPPPNSTFQTRKYGMSELEQPFVNHIMACERCKPKGGFYCGEALMLKEKVSFNFL
jgi:hypothetical protein